MVDKIKDPARDEAFAPSIPNKLLEFQKRVSAISKDSVNPFFKSKYFDVNTVIDTIKPILNEIGLVVMQPLEVRDGKNILITDIWDENRLLRNSAVLVPEIADIQKFGAALTYLRRYALVSLLLLQGEEDDDGNTAVKQKKVSNSNDQAKAVSDPNKATTSTNSGNLMTDKQNRFIHVLMKQKGVLHLSDIGIEKIEKPTMMDAKNIIDKLQTYQPESKELPTIQIEQGEYPE